MKTKKYISLINDERKDRNVISQKGCSRIVRDECSYADDAHCTGIMVNDICDYDFEKCGGLWSDDVCNKDT